MLRYLCAMGIFGTIGLFVRWVDLPASAVALSRGLLGALALYVLLRLSGDRLNREAWQRNALRLFAAGFFLAGNWIFLFEAYSRTSIATATLLYYMAPVLLILLSPMVLRERLTVLKFVCVLVALVGMALVSGIPGASLEGDLSGITFGLLAACFYTGVVLNNKFLKGVPENDSVIVQLGLAALLMIPYVFLTEDVSSFSLDGRGAAALLALGLIHTALAYRLYFSSIPAISAQRIALFSFIDPVVAILLSVFVLGEPLSLSGWIGAGLILGAALVSETVGRKG